MKLTTGIGLIAANVVLFIGTVCFWGARVTLNGLVDNPITQDQYQKMGFNQQEAIEKATERAENIRWQTANRNLRRYENHVEDFADKHAPHATAILAGSLLLTAAFCRKDSRKQKEQGQQSAKADKNSVPGV